MKVLKFGGTSVGTPQSLANVKKIVETAANECDQVIVVVSALGGVTDQLIKTASLASQGDMRYLQLYAQIVERHLDVVDAVVLEEFKPKVRAKINSLLEELGNIFYAINLLRDLSTRTLDMVVSFGERMSSLIISRMIPDARYLYSPEFIITTNRFGKHILDNEETALRVHETIDALDFKISIAPGFISTDKNGDITNLGRGGSDYTAAILGALLKADILEIWTDVDGFMTADPRLIPSAFVMDTMTFPEAMELCNFGAKVIYPPTLYPVYHKNIPVVVKNTFNPDAPGTMISSKASSDSGIKGISTIKDVGVLSITASEHPLPEDVDQRVFNALANNGISSYFATDRRSDGIEEFDYSHSSRQYVVKGDDLKSARELLADEFSDDIRQRLISNIRTIDSLALVAAVGSQLNLIHKPLQGALDSLAKGGISVVTDNIGESASNFTVVVPAESLTEALSNIHISIFGK